MGYNGKGVTHVGRGQAQIEMTSEGMDRATRLEFCRYVHSASDMSYNLNVPAKALVNRAGKDHENLRDYECGWYIPTSEWPDGLEAALITLCAPWLPLEEAKVKAAVDNCTNFEERIQKCLVTSEGSLKAIRYALSVSLCNAAAVPLGQDGVLLDEEPIWKHCAHPVFNAAVFSSESFATLEALVIESQKKAEEKRKDPPLPLSVQEYRATAARMETNIISAIRGTTANSSPASGTATTTVQDAVATAIRNSTGTLATGTSTSTAGLNLPAPATVTAGTGTAIIAASAAPTPGRTAASNITAAARHAGGPFPGQAAAAAAPTPATTRRGTDRQIKPKMNRQMQSAAHYWKIYGRKGSFYCQNENLMTIRDIWTEYERGWNHGPALKHLNAHEKQWNKYGAAKSMYCKRKAIYDTILKMMNRDGLTEDECISRLQDELDAFPKSDHRKKPSLERFNKKLRDRLTADADAANTAGASAEVAEDTKMEDV